MKQQIFSVALALASLAGLSAANAQVKYQLTNGDTPLKVNRVVYGSLPGSGCADCGAAAGCGCESKGGKGDGAGPSVAPDADDLAQPADFGDPLGAYSSAQGVIGDFFGGGLRVNIQGSVFSVPIASGDRQFKIVENLSPFPTDRVFFNYHLFNNPAVSADGRDVDVSRFTFGCERTLMNGMISYEVRIPFASGLAATQDIDPGLPDDNDGTEFGNITFAIKALLVDRGNYAVSAGLAVTTPTGKDAVFLDDGTLEGVFRNEAYHLQPFIAFMLRPTDRSWLQVIGQATFDMNGNTISFIDEVPGVIQDQALLFISASHGVWIYRDDTGNSIIRGIAPIIELHYSTTMQDTDFQITGGGIINNPFNRMDVLNVTGGIRLQMGPRTYVTASGVAPLHGGDNNVFDSEFSLQVVRTR